MDYGYSVNSVPIRLTWERWYHIVENHDDMAGYYEDVLSVVEDPDMVLTGYRGALIAIKGYGRNRYLSVVYRETSTQDGFVVTAYFTDQIDRQKAIWKK
jgi:hypothetical protein